jgi:hypothetical protein
LHNAQRSTIDQEMSDMAKTGGTKTAAKRKASKAEGKPQSLVAYKGFDRDLRCRGFQYEIGKTYEHTGSLEVCQSGFHSCEHPLDVFNYYPPSTSRFAQVEAHGAMKRHDADTKVCSAKITITAELHLHELIAQAVQWVFDRATPENTERATGYQGAASATGNQGAASATGNQGAASATGYQGAASATGYRGAASATGYQGAASATGYRGAASATGNQGAAMSCGYEGRVSGKQGCALFLTERNDDYEIIAVWAGIVGRDGVEPNIFYTLKNGKPVAVSEAA